MKAESRSSSPRVVMQLNHQGPSDAKRFQNSCSPFTEIFALCKHTTEPPLLQSPPCFFRLLLEPAWVLFPQNLQGTARPPRLLSSLSLSL